MNTITVYVTKDDLIVSKLSVIEKLSQLNNVEQAEQLKSQVKGFDVYLTNWNKNRVAFNLDFATFSLLAIFIGGNFIND